MDTKLFVLRHGTIQQCIIMFMLAGLQLTWETCSIFALALCKGWFWLIHTVCAPVVYLQRGSTSTQTVNQSDHFPYWLDVTQLLLTNIGEWNLATKEIIYECQNRFKTSYFIVIMLIFKLDHFVYFYWSYSWSDESAKCNSKMNSLCNLSSDLLYSSFSI